MSYGKRVPMNFGPQVWDLDATYQTMRPPPPQPATQPIIPAAQPALGMPSLPNRPPGLGEPLRPLAQPAIPGDVAAAPSMAPTNESKPNASTPEVAGSYNAMLKRLHELYLAQSRMR